MNTIRLKRRIVGALAVIALGMPLATFAQSSSEKEESSGKESDRRTHELGHVLQQEKSPRSRPGERVMRPKYGAGQDGDPDRPVISGRVPDPHTADGSVPTETLSLNFEKIIVPSVRVSERLRHKNRALFLGQDKQIYVVPDGIYSNKTGGEVEIAHGRVRYSDITLKRGYTASDGSSGDVIMKGSNIKENAASTDEKGSEQATGRRTHEPIVIRKRIDKSSPAVPGSQLTPSQNKVIAMAAASEDGRYTGPGGAWIEIKGGEIVAIGGRLERHKPPPFYDVTGDGGISRRD